MSWTCPICGQQHAADAPCPTLLQQSGSGTQVMSAGKPFTPQPHAAQLHASTPVAAPPVPAPHGPVGASPAGSPGVDPLIGTTIGSFKIVRNVGKGGMGTVYLGEQTVIGSRVAIKILHEHLAANPSLVQRFYAEARAVNLIGHENIVNIFDMNVVPPSRYYLIMEYLEGRPLNLALKGPMAPEVAIPILLQVCDALQAAHSHGVVHRDLKPENIYLIKRGRNENFAKILDFGIAKLFATELKGETTSVGTIVGTPEYMAPEQTTGDRIDGRSDIYSLGVIAYLMAVGRLPFSGGGLAGMLIAHQQKIPDAPAALNPRVPLEWSDVIMKALSKRPDDRYPDADAFGAALADVLGSLPHPAQAPPPSRGGYVPSTSLPYTSTPPSFGTPPVNPHVATPPHAVAPRPSAPNVPPAAPRGAPGFGFRPEPAPPPVRTPEPRTPVPPPTQAAPVVPNTYIPPPVIVAQAPPVTTTPPVANLQPTPQPQHARHAAKFDAIVTLADGKSLGSLPCQDISKGGMFLCTEVTPPMFSRVKVKLPVAGDLDCFAEVVRHVTADQARAWNMSPGFGVQFLDLTTAQKDTLGRVVQGLPVAKATSTPKSDDDDRVAAQVLAQFGKRINGDHYVVLALAPTAELSDVRARGRELLREMESLKSRPLSTRQQEMISTVTQKVQEAMAVVGSASKRISYDANHNNFVGVWHCIAAGLTVTEIDAARRAYLNAHPGAETNGHVKFVTGNAWENKGSWQMAKENYEAALSVDPLNLRIHQRYRELLRRHTSGA